MVLGPGLPAIDLCHMWQLLRPASWLQAIFRPVRKGFAFKACTVPSATDTCQALPCALYCGPVDTGGTWVNFEAATVAQL